MNHLPHHLVVMSKAPRIGRVKSRLAQDIGWVRAWAFYRTSLFATARKLMDRRGPRWRCWLSVTPDVAVYDSRQFPPGWTLISQGSGGLGDRMLRPWLTLPPGPVVIVGCDIPDLKPAHIAAAFKALGDNDLVFGPATDGGFWLVGAKRRPCVLNPFTGVRWSSAETLADTLERVPKGRKIGFVQTLTDVDDAKNLYVGFKPNAL